jgi:class 3 adenylate cyclase
MRSERERLEALIEGLESQRGLLGDAFVDAGLAPLCARLAALAEVQASATPSQTLRQVSILFLDIVGSTLLSQHLDPEEVHAVMDGSLMRCTAIVEAHHGKVLQYAGDNLLAVFGAGEAREDDAERAVRCGLALLAEGRALGAEVKRQHGREGFDVRVGVHTGGVLLGGGVDAEGSIRGMAVNIAARMEQTAPAGALRISHDTYRHVRGVFEVEAQDRIAVKGVDDPVATYLVRRANPRAFRIGSRGIEGVETRMIGRDDELATLQRAFLRLFVERRTVLVAVVGEAGLGKSRLLHEFEAWSEARPEVVYLFQGRANPLTVSQPYGLLRDLIARRLQIGDGDSVDVAKRKIEDGLVPLFGAGEGADMAEANAHLLGHLIGLDFSDSRHIGGIRDDARQIRNRAFHAAAQMFRRIAAGDVANGGVPIVMQLEDLHWADDGTLDLLKHLATVNHDVPMLVLCVTRPTLFERRADWLDGIHERIDLSPLSRSISQWLANELLRKLAPVPLALAELIVGRAEGNPFYMEELVKMLVDQGAIETTGERWTLRADKLLAAEVPQSLTGVLQARLDALPRPEWLALQEASVIGLVFWDRALAALDSRAPEALPALARRELIRPRPDAALDDVREYAFGHQILHGVTYGTLLKRSKRALHARAAAWLAGQTGARASDFLGAAAEHYELAGDSLQASEYFTRAAEHAKSRFAHDAALGHVGRALALLDREPATSPAMLALRWRLVVVREFMLNLQGKRAEQHTTLDVMQALADALDDDRRRAFASRRRSQFGLRTADYRGQEAAARQAIALATRAGDDESRLEAQRLLADALAALGDLAAAQVLAQSGLVEARTRGLRRVEGTYLNALSFIAALQDDQVAGLALDQQDLPIWRELGDRQGETTALGNVGADWLWFGEFPQARCHLEEALKIARAIGSRQMECGPLGNLSQLALWHGDAAEALVQARSALETAVTVQAPDFEVSARNHLGAAELALGRHEAAARTYEQAESMARRVGVAAQHDATAGRARAALALADVAGAVALVEGLLAQRAAGETFEGAESRLILLTCHQVLARAADPRAGELLDSAHADLQARAATIADAALRESFLGNVPQHREIVAAWRRSKTGG